MKWLFLNKSLALTKSIVQFLLFKYDFVETHFPQHVSSIFSSQRTGNLVPTRKWKYPRIMDETSDAVRPVPHQEPKSFLGTIFGSRKCSTVQELERSTLVLFHWISLALQVYGFYTCQHDIGSALFALCYSIGSFWLHYLYLIFI